MDGLFDRRDGRIALGLYRLLAEGEPVSDERLTAPTGRSASEIANWLRVELDERGRVVGFHPWDRAGADQPRGPNVSRERL